MFKFSLEGIFLRFSTVTRTKDLNNFIVLVAIFPYCPRKIKAIYSAMA